MTSLISELKASVSKSNQDKAKQEAKDRRREREADARAKKNGLKQAPDIVRRAIERVKDAAKDGETRTKLYLGPTQTLELTWAASFASEILKKEHGLSSIGTFHHEWKTDGDNGWNESDYSLHIWGW